MAFRSELRQVIKEEISLALGPLAKDKDSSSKKQVKSSQVRSSEGTLSFDEFYKAREAARQSDFQPKAKKKKCQDPKSSVKEVEVKVCLACHNDGVIKARRGKLQVIKVNSDAGREQLLKKALEKHAQFDQNFDDSVPYRLLYPDFSHVDLIPGTKELFTLQAYKLACGKEFKRLTFYLLPIDDDTDSDCDSNDNTYSRKSSFSIESFMDKYGTGQVFEETCPKCNTTVNGLYSAGVHDMKNGCIKVYSDDEKFVCPKCSQPSTETLTSSVSEEEVKDILLRFISKTIVNTDGDDMLNILVSRKAILQSTLRAIERKSFSFERPVLVSFAGEDGMDAGGPKREFFRLLMQSLKEIGIFDGSGWFVHDLSLLKQRKYELAGKLISWSILQGGTGPKCLAMEALCIAQDKPIDQEKVIEIVCDVKLKEILKALKAAKDEEFPNLIKKHGDDIAEYGYSAIYTSKSSDKQKIVDCLLKQSFLFSVYAEIEQFRKGMNMVGGFGDIVFESYPVFQSVLGNNQDKLTSNVIKANYKVCFSEAGSNNKEKELETIYCFELFMKDLEEGQLDDDLSLSDLLIFMTGADCVPPLGFDNQISIEFYDHCDRERRLPWSSTCSLSLNLPRGITDPPTFNALMCRSLKEGQGFGKC